MLSQASLAYLFARDPSGEERSALHQLNLKRKIFSILKWIGWVALVQFILLNISAALYAHKFTYFYNDPSLKYQEISQNIFKKTWRLFAGQRYLKSVITEAPTFPFDTVTFHTKKGILIEGWYSRADTSAKGTVILFHGLTQNKATVLAEASDFRFQGYNVLLLDFRAHGNSGDNITTIGYRETEEVKLAWDYVKGKGEKNIFLWGSSMGAVAVAKAVSDYAIQPSGIILEMPFASLQSHLRSRARTIGFRGFPEKPFGFLVTCWIGIERGFNGFNFSTVSYARKIHCPVLLQWGALDYAVLRSETEKIFDAIASPVKKLVIYDNASHESFLQRDPPKWRGETEKFLSTCLHPVISGS